MAWGSVRGVKLGGSCRIMFSGNVLRSAVALDIPKTYTF